jgi:hypothetical protein
MQAAEVAEQMEFAQLTLAVLEVGAQEVEATLAPMDLQIQAAAEVAEHILQQIMVAGLADLE